MSSIQPPQRLREIPSPPKALALRGDRGALSENLSAVAVVGSRRPSPQAEAAAWKISGGIARTGGVVVSGLARGIDSVANRAAIAAGGRTVCVMPAGVEDRELTPRTNVPLAEEILEAGGALVSELPLPAKLQPFHFVLRDRIQSGLAQAVVVCSSELQGGAMHTARFAADQGRAVFVPQIGAAAVGDGAQALLDHSIAELRELAPAFKAKRKPKTDEEREREQRPLAQAVAVDEDWEAWLNELQ